MKSSKKTIRKKIFIVLISLLVLCLIGLNVHFALKSNGENSNLFTAISGWLGVIATAGIGMITVFQNRHYQQRAYMQYKIDGILRARDIVYSNCKQFCSSDAVFNVSTMVFWSQGSTAMLSKECASLMLLSNLSKSHILDLHNLRYNFGEIIKLVEQLNEFCNAIDKFVKRPQINDNYKKICELYEDIEKSYHDLLAQIDNDIAILQYEKMTYKEFVKHMNNLQSIEQKCQKIQDLLDKSDNKN